MEDKILNVIVAVERAKLAAKDLHYRASGREFFALHLLADKVDFGSSIDDLKEAYYLGQGRLGLLSKEKDIMKKVVEAQEHNGDELSIVYETLADVLYSIEEAKREPDLMAGVHAILDNISSVALIAKGLIDKSIA